MHELHMRDRGHKPSAKGQLLIGVGSILLVIRYRHRKAVDTFKIRQTKGVFRFTDEADHKRCNIRVFAGQPHRIHML